MLDVDALNFPSQFFSVMLLLREFVSWKKSMRSLKSQCIDSLVGGLNHEWIMTFQKLLVSSSSQLTIRPSFFRRGRAQNHQPAMLYLIYNPITFSFHSIPLGQSHVTPACKTRSQKPLWRKHVEKLMGEITENGSTVFASPITFG